MNPQETTSAFGAGEFLFEVDPAWPQVPEGWSFLEVAGVATDSRDQVYVFNRGEHPVMVFQADGTFVSAWGEGEFVRPHGIWIGPDDAVYLTDDLGHTVRKYTAEGELRMTLGTPGSPSGTGVENFDYRTIRQAAGPFHFPTNLVLNSEGEMYVSDGYGNARVHKFSAHGNLLFSWGEPGDGPGQFNLPHGIAVDGGGRVFVADRENDRLQIFSPGGEFLDAWNTVVRPCQVFIDDRDNVFVAEVGRRVGLFPWMRADLSVTGGRVSVFTIDGDLQARWGGGEHPAEPGDFYAPHDVCVDSQGSVYVGEVTWSAGGNKGLAPPNCPTLQKFTRKTG